MLHGQAYIKAKKHSTSEKIKCRKEQTLTFEIFLLSIGKEKKKHEPN